MYNNVCKGKVKIMDHNLIVKFHQGMCLDAHQIFGAHFAVEDGVEGVRFCVWAPEAFGITVIGEFNGWDTKANPMKRLKEDGSIWVCFIPEVEELAGYKYHIQTKYGRYVDRADPYAFYSELRPGTASRVYNMEGYQWQDDKWMKERTRNFDKPLNIYEAHLGSWKFKEEATEEDDGIFYTYEEMIDEIIPYVKKMGYTHLELMPLAEHPFDGSWGYQVTGYFSATSRYGTPKQLMKFIDACHQADIGVIMDFVPVHFVQDAHGLYEFDGSHLYDYPDINRRYSEWGTAYFDLGREEVRSFMMSSVDFWLSYFHMDGVRFDAISNIIYWRGNKNIGLNDGAVDFMKRCNYHIHQRFDNVMMIAEDSSDYPNVTKSTLDGGLGFDYKWDLGWMNDTLKYMGRDPIYRQYHHNDMTFSMAYFYSERFILPFSHDEVVHGKRTIIDKIWGDFDQKFAQLKSLYVYMFTHPGKKLNFMGNELAEFKEWDEKKSLGWNILTFPTHDAFHHFVADLNQLYLAHDAMYVGDYRFDGFKWLIVDDNQQSLFAYTRKSPKGDTLITVMNFTSNSHDGLRVPVEKAGWYKEILNTDKDVYAGSNLLNPSLLESETVPWVNEENSICINLAPFSSVILKLEKEKVIEKKETTKKKEKENKTVEKKKGL